VSARLSVVFRALRAWRALASSRALVDHRAEQPYRAAKPPRRRIGHLANVRIAHLSYSRIPLLANPWDGNP
jgi:hypothetical protein